ncbi:hypothetical protein [Streptomyces alkaliphilus]|uniref:hypothetical protein n=1 Tax=Streptomyces alkaliphilus TaxID=1472722 RepID=UPI00117ECBA2|nr:hypothetical protein [Streptomyces alkaliphilus]MQS07075.1 hypothetical protein [Streptomyces alkaliphilus]
MPLLFLNEKSLGTACEPARAERAMTRLAKAVLAVLREDREGTILIGPVPLRSIEIAEGLPLAKWLNSTDNRDIRRRLLLMQDRWPHSTVFPEGESFTDTEYRHDGERVEGLAAAHLMGGAGVSLPIHPRWDAAHLTLDREQLREDPDGSLTTVRERVGLRHLSDEEHYGEHRSWVRGGAAGRRRGALLNVRTGADLWENRAGLFPHLRFLPRVEGQLTGLAAVSLPSVRERLAQLDDAAAEWDPVARPIAPLWKCHVRTEFERRRTLCWFDDGGRRECFEWHCDFLPAPGRIHFRLVHAERLLRVAHIGRKLGV